MRTRLHSFALVAIVLSAAPANAETMRSSVRFNTAIQTPSGKQPPDGVAISYLVTLSGGALDRCEADIAESLFPRDGGAWGIFQVQGDVTCDRGSFRFTSSGAWDGNGFHGSGGVVAGSGVGAYDGLEGRIAQIGGTLAPAAAEGTFDVGYELLVDRAAE